MRRIASGVTDQFVYFQTLTGLSGFTVYRSRNGAAWAAMTTPTITEGDSTNAPGIMELLLDEDMTIGAGNLTEHMAFYITAAGMQPKFLEVELFAPANYTIGTVTANTDMRGTDSAALASVCTEARLAELAAGNLPTDIAAIPTTAMRGTDSALLAASVNLTGGNIDANIVKVAGGGDIAADGSTVPDYAEP